MNSFQNYVFVFTFFCLIIALTFTAIALKSKKSTNVYPPIIDNCPDYWYSSYHELDSSNNLVPSSACKDTQFGCCPDNITPKEDDAGTTCPTSLCYNVKKLGTVSDSCPKKMDFSKYSTCEKQTWAKSCNITWDGITNMPSAC
jgi:hypothetical protein